MSEVLFANCDKAGNYTLEGRPELVLSEADFKKIQKLIGTEQNVSHWVIFRDFSGGRKT